MSATGLTALRVLFTGDQRHVAQITRELRAGGFQLTVRRADTEGELKRQLYPKPDLVVADCADEGMNARRVLALLGGQARILPVIVIVDPADEVSATLCLELGAVDYLHADRLARAVPAVRRVLAEQAARAGHWLAEQRLRDEAERLGAIVDTQHEIAASGLDLHAVMSITAKRAQSLTRADGAAVELLEGTETVQLAASGNAAKHAGARRPLAGAISGQCVRSRQILRFDDVEREPFADPEIRILSARGHSSRYRCFAIVPWSAFSRCFPARCPHSTSAT